MERRHLDRISKLPDAVLVKILSSLPTTKDVVATSVLSKQWRSLWKMVPKLTFSYNGGNDIQGFSDSVRRTMLSLEAPYLQSLHLDVEGDRMDGFGELLGIACGLHVRELVLKLYGPDDNRHPIILDNCPSLETLKVLGEYGSIALEVPSPVCLKSLRTLHLQDVFYEDDDESVENLLAGCVSLQDLFVARWGHDGVETFAVDVPSLQELTIEDNVFDNSDYVINTPSLKKITINAIGNPIGSEFMMIDAPELVEANIWTHADFLMGESFSSVKRLSLSISDLKVPAGSIFNQLEHLQLLTEHLDSWNPLMVMLDNSPNLQALEIIEHFGEVKWKRPKHVPRGLLHLKTLDWLVRGLTYGEEVAKYILSNAKSLESVILRLDRTSFDEYFPEKDRLKVCHDFEGWCPDDCEFELITIV